MKKELVFTLCLLACCTALFALAATPLFTVQKIAVQGNQAVTSEEIQKELAGFQGENLLLLDPDLLSRKLAGDKRILQTRIKLTWPNRMVVEVTEKKPIFLLKLGKILGLAQNGEILPLDTADQYQLPWVVGLKGQGFRPYSCPHLPELQQLLEFYRAVQSINKELWSLISEIDLTTRDDLTLQVVPGDIKVRLGRGNYAQKVSRLVEILGLEEEPVAGIDLRFENMGLVRHHSRGEM